MKPPRIARWLLLALTPTRFREQLDGDTSETYTTKRRERGRTTAYLWYWRQLFSLDVFRLLMVERKINKQRAIQSRGQFSAIVQDIRFGVRTFRKQPMFASAVIFTLGLGIGATTAVFTIVNAVLIRPLPYENPDQLVMIFRTVPRFGFTRSTASFPDFNDWRNQSTSVSAMAAYGYTTATYVDANNVSQWQGYRVTSDLFSLLGVGPMLGRLPTHADDMPTAGQTILLSHGLWMDRFGGDSTVVGRTVQLDGNSATVIGVMAREFTFPTRGTQYWTPLRGDVETMERDSNFLTVIARLGPNGDVSTAQAELSTLAAQIDEVLPDGNRGYGIFVEQQHQFIVRNARGALLMFLGAVALVLMVALTNVANLMLAKGTTRVREFALRTALGAGRRRIFLQLVTESTVLAGLGGLFGLILATGLTRSIVALGSQQLPRADEIHIDPVVLGFVALLSIMSGVAFGTLPAIIASRTDPQRWLKDSSATFGLGLSGRRIQQTLVVAEIAIALTLTIGAGLLLNSFAKLTAVDPGFHPENIVAGRIAAPRPEMDVLMRSDEAARSEARASQRLFYEAIIERAASQPGTIAVGLAYGLPLDKYTFGRVLQPEGLTNEQGSEPVVNGNLVAADYFRAMGISLIRGRTFGPGDGFDAAGVVIVNEAMANAFWPGEDAIGKRIKIGPGDRPWSTVVGVAANTVSRSLADDPEPTYYRPYAQAPWPDAMFVVLRTTTPAEGVVESLRSDIRSINATIPLTDITTASQLIAESVAEPRFRTLLLSVFGFAAAILALVGIYGVIAFSVADRTREIGIRLALGADRTKVLKMVLIRGVGLATVGVTIGLTLAFALTRFLTSMLYGVTALDPITFGTCAVGLVVLSVVACYGPARRAANNDPLISLRTE